MNFRYYIPTKIVFGSGRLDKLNKLDLPGKKALIVTSGGKSVKANGYLERLEKQLDMAGVGHVLFDKILPNPVKRHVMEGAKMARDNGCDFVIGLGGGSPIDSSKSIAVMATNDGDYWDYVVGGSGKEQPVKNDPLPIVAITTTAGTGTEADQWTVITDEDTNEKIGFGYEKTFPTLAIVDPELMLTVPPVLTAYQGFDALFHSAEGYIASIASPLGDMMALESIRLIGKSLAAAVKDGKNLQAREDVAWANTLAGMVEAISSCISEHAMEHPMSGHHPELPHGAGLIMICESYFSTIVDSHACDEKLVNMAKALGKKDAKDPKDFVAALQCLQKACGVDNLKMSDYGITKEELPALAKAARDTMGGLFDLDPTTITQEDVVRIYEESYK
ncbi:iron-containing alcohol dehydrogenase [Christensenellaceae bacterium OttesenSCG-928-K19]|nr:iron-containing alcohol dehydrogenase [Christensenellaceae bacterium OttesenSCG-928-K19]